MTVGWCLTNSALEIWIIRKADLMAKDGTEPMPSKITPEREELAKAVRDAATALNAAIDAANNAGIQISFGVSTWTSKPSKSHVNNLIIEMPCDWQADYPGEKL
jgi:hypothetical protein